MKHRRFFLRCGIMGIAVGYGIAQFMQSDSPIDRSTRSTDGCSQLYSHEISYLKRIRSIHNDPQTSENTDWTAIKCGGAHFSLRPGSWLVQLKFGGELTCLRDGMCKGKFALDGPGIGCGEPCGGEILHQSVVPEMKSLVQFYRINCTNAPCLYTSSFQVYVEDGGQITIDDMVVNIDVDAS